ncbi:hypothetical protein N7536_000262 [Penicillium majusculum]|nr:hypothetical protein N7536_000262 [Penicillium majusculum]
MAITFKVDRKKHQVKMETWEWNSNVPNPHLFQSCVIEKTGDKITVSQYPFTIPFNYMLQRPAKYPRETDVQLEKQHLINVAASVWPGEKT